MGGDCFNHQLEMPRAPEFEQVKLKDSMAKDEELREELEDVKVILGELLG